MTVGNTDTNVGAVDKALISLTSRRQTDINEVVIHFIAPIVRDWRRDDLKDPHWEGTVRAMLVKALRQLLLALTALAFLGGTTVQAMSFAKPAGAAKPAMAMTASGDCDQMGMGAHDGGAKTSMPCKSMTFDCLLKMGCGASAVSFAATSYIQPAPIAYSTVSYSRFSAVRSGRSLTPDPFPPKTLA